MKTSIATIGQIIAYIGMSPLLPVIALMWVFALLANDAPETTEEAMMRLQPAFRSYRTDSQVIMLNTSA